MRAALAILMQAALPLSGKQALEDPASQPGRNTASEMLSSAAVFPLVPFLNKTLLVSVMASLHCVSMLLGGCEMIDE